MADREGPLVSIGLPTRNRSSGLVRSIQSVLAQDYRPLELIISDNASTDETASVCGEFVRENSWISYEPLTEDIGAVGNFNRVLRLAHGEYFMWLADDDWLEPNYVSACLEELRRDSDLVLVCGLPRYVDGDRAVDVGERINLQAASPVERVEEFYATVRRNGIFYGLMPRKLASMFPLEDTFGSDWFFVSSLASIGKIRTLEATSIFRSVGGASELPRGSETSKGRPKLSQPHLLLSVKILRNTLRQAAALSGLRKVEAARLALRCQRVVRKRFSPHPLRRFVFAVLSTFAPATAQKIYHLYKRVLHPESQSNGSPKRH